ncbi:unnamed protein product [Cylicostephanus goldi]|uniref:Uncharacterized protein n=1 Tax=Cylicostephanus goldi TaxID=71465 RepID=A0A3P7N7T0_CYLGO|nr:unnamed protein product [Cylicostephanus goldi]
MDSMENVAAFSPVTEDESKEQNENEVDSSASSTTAPEYTTISPYASSDEPSSTTPATTLEELQKGITDSMSDSSTAPSSVPSMSTTDSVATESVASVDLSTIISAGAYSTENVSTSTESSTPEIDPYGSTTSEETGATDAGVEVTSEEPVTENSTDPSTEASTASAYIAEAAIAVKKQIPDISNVDFNTDDQNNREYQVDKKIDRSQSSLAQNERREPVPLEPTGIGRNMEKLDIDGLGKFFEIT